MPITSKIETVSPETAFKYLESFKGNRAIMQSHVDYLASQMKNDLWKTTHQGIAFNVRNELVDGHHRMWACVQSGETIKIQVSKGLTDEDVLYLDMGRNRDMKDAAHYAGVDVDPMVWSVVKILAMGVTTSNTKIPFQVEQTWYEHYKAGIDAAIEIRNSCQPMKRKMTAPMTAAFARAFYNMHRDELARFAMILREGQVEVKADKAAFTLRDAWFSDRLGKGRSEQYFKTCAALRAFKERREIKTLQRTEEEVFKIPALPKALVYKTIQHNRAKKNGAEGAKLRVVKSAA